MWRFFYDWVGRFFSVSFGLFGIASLLLVFELYPLLALIVLDLRFVLEKISVKPQKKLPHYFEAVSLHSTFIITFSFRFGRDNPGQNQG